MTSTRMKGGRHRGRVGRTNVVSVGNGHERLERLLDHGVGELRAGDRGGRAHHRHDLLALDLVVLRVVVHDERAHHALLQRAVLADAVKDQPLVQLCVCVADAREGIKGHAGKRGKQTVSWLLRSASKHFQMLRTHILLASVSGTHASHASRVTNGLSRSFSGPSAIMSRNCFLLVSYCSGFTVTHTHT